MTDWNDADFDALVRETMAIVKNNRVEPPMPPTLVEPSEAGKHLALPAVNSFDSERDEIRQRVANFKAHQKRFTREREDYAASPSTHLRPA
jgi:hypothetical protein